MNIKRWAAWLLLVCALCAGQALAVEEIDHYTVKADIASFLTPEQTELYRRLVDAVLARREEVRLSDDYDANLSALYALKNNPLYCLVARDDFSADHTALSLQYAYSGEEQAEMVACLDGEYLRILNEIIDPDMNELEKTLAVYAYFGHRIDYDYDWALEREVSDDPLFFPEIDIFSALTSNRGVCHTYTCLCEYALQQLGVECLRFTGCDESDGDTHMWLVVRIDGKYYHCDPTWDDEGDEVGLRYFGMTDAERRESGVRDFEWCYDASYGEVVCDDTAFAPFRSVWKYELLDGHRLLLYVDDRDDPLTFDTERLVLLK